MSDELTRLVTERRFASRALDPTARRNTRRGANVKQPPASLDDATDAAVEYEQAERGDAS